MFLNSAVICRRATLIALGLLAASLAGGCPAKAPDRSTTADNARWGGRRGKTKAAPARQKPRYWRDEIGQYHTIPKLWNAINRHHDALGHSLYPRYPTTTVVAPRRRIRPRPRTGDPGVVRPRPPRIDRPPVTQYARAPLCRRACNHVRAICYAARRICQIARRLRDHRALLTCKRAKARCTSAKQAARRRCRACD